MLSHIYAYYIAVVDFGEYCLCVHASLDQKRLMTQTKTILMNSYEIPAYLYELEIEIKIIEILINIEKKKKNSYSK